MEAPPKKDLTVPRFSTSSAWKEIKHCSARLDDVTLAMDDEPMQAQLLLPG